MDLRRREEERRRAIGVSDPSRELVLRLRAGELERWHVAVLAELGYGPAEEIEAPDPEVRAYGRSWVLNERMLARVIPGSLPRDRRRRDHVRRVFAIGAMLYMQRIFYEPVLPRLIAGVNPEFAEEVNASISDSCPRIDPFGYPIELLEAFRRTTLLPYEPVQVDGSKCPAWALDVVAYEYTGHDFDGEGLAGVYLEALRALAICMSDYFVSSRMPETREVDAISVTFPHLRTVFGEASAYYGGGMFPEWQVVWEEEAEAIDLFSEILERGELTPFGTPVLALLRPATAFLIRWLLRGPYG